MVDDDELDEIKRRKLEELRYQRQRSEEEEREYGAKRAEILRAYLTPDARERLGSLRLVRPELAGAIEDQIIALAASGRLNRMVDDETLKRLLKTAIPKKRREPKITFKHK
jgi:programmed cell death protein 5